MALSRILALMVGSAVQALRFTSVGSNPVISGSGTTLTSTTAGSGRATPVAAGKRYCEMLLVSTAGTSAAIGIANGSMDLNSGPGQDGGQNSWGLTEVGSLYRQAAATTGFAAFTAGDWIGVAVDTAAARVWFSKNGVWMNGDPVAGTSTITVDSFGFTYIIAGSYTNACVWKISETFRYPAPSGYSAF